MFKDLKEIIIKTVTHRLFILFLVFAFLFSLMISKLFQLQIVDGQQHLDNFVYKSLKNLEINNARGNIYDANGNLLAYNKLAYKVTYDNSTDYTQLAKENKTNTDYEMNKALHSLITMLESNGDEIVNDFPVILTSKGNFKFSTTSEATLNRFKREVFKIDNKEDLSEDEQRQMNSNAKEVFEYLRSGKGSSNPDKIKGYNISEEYTVEDALKIMAIRYNIKLNRYTQYNDVTIAMDVSEDSVAQITENQSIYLGVGVAADSLRVYNYSKYYAHIIGYTGIISTDELDTLNVDKKDDDPDYYSANDVVGKAGLEQKMEEYLQGRKGTRQVFVDNLGKVLEETDRTDPIAGNDVYLTIDTNLQKYCYDTLEQRLAGILYQHLTPGTSIGTSKNRLVPIQDVYFALLDNNVVDISRFSRKNASDNEKGILSKLNNKRTSAIANIKTNLSSSTASVSSLSDEMKDYVLFIYDMLNEHNILQTSNIDNNDSVVIAWKNRKISLGEFLKYAVQNSWIDISNFEIDNDFYDIDTIYAELLNYIARELENEADFDKLLYKYMIKQGILSGREVCLALYDQNVLSKKKDESDYNKLVNGTYSSYSFMREKIKKIDITPAQLALEPSSGSIVVTDPNNGNILAMVSYPSYDNNRLANSVDSAYFNKLIEDKSSPMLFRAMQSKTAPGSTFKGVSSAALLEEGIVNTGTTIVCTGIYDKINQGPKCHIFPGSHGRENIEDAIRDSCNYYFFEGAYRMGTIAGRYNSELALNRLNKYTAMFGFDKTSGIGLPESQPQMSDMDAIRSSIGQGTNNYTPSQISRYVTTVANQGTVYNLNILDSVQTPDGDVVESYQAEAINELNFQQSTWNSIANGMHKVVNGGSANMKKLFVDYGLVVSGKTGTAQEKKTSADHALFISYAPSSKPEITVTTVIPNGYTSANAAQITSDVYRYYFKVEDDNDDNSSKVSNTISNNNLLSE